MHFLTSLRTVGRSTLAFVLLVPALQAHAEQQESANAPAAKQPDTQEKPPYKISDGPKTVDPATLVPAPVAAKATVEFVESSLREIAQWIQQQQGIPVLLDKAALSDEGISLHEPVTDRLRNEPVYLLLNRLSSLGLAWYVEEDILHITTQTVAEEQLLTESYNVGDLFDSGYDPETLVQTLMAMTEGPWEENEGTGGVIQGLRDILFVRTTPAVHREVQGLLSALRKHGRETFTLDPPPHVVLREKLNQQVSVKFADTPLFSAVQELAEETQSDIRLDIRSLQEEGIREREPVTLTLSERKLGAVLHVLLADLELTWMLRDGVLWITTTVVAEGELKTVVYDVGDLCTTGEETDELKDALQSQTEGPWEEQDGTGGTIEFPVTNTMVIRQTESVLSEVRELLATYRKALSTSKRREKEVLDPQTVETRYYRMGAETAADLSKVLPQLVQPETWCSDENPEATGRILQVASGRELLDSKGRIVHGVSKSAGDGKSPSDALVVLQSVLIIRQTRAAHDEIAKVIARVEQGDPQEAGVTGGMGGIGGGGGFYSVQ